GAFQAGELIVAQSLINQIQAGIASVPYRVQVLDTSSRLIGVQCPSIHLDSGGGNRQGQLTTDCSGCRHTIIIHQSQHVFQAQTGELQVQFVAGKAELICQGFAVQDATERFNTNGRHAQDPVAAIDLKVELKVFESQSNVKNACCQA